jgi:hypothetical protein
MTALVHFKTGNLLEQGRDGHDYMSQQQHFTIKRYANKLNGIFDYQNNLLFNDQDSSVIIEDNTQYVACLNVKKGGKNMLMENTFQIRFLVYKIIGNQKIMVKDNFYDKVYPIGTNYQNPSASQIINIKANYRSFTYTEGTYGETDEIVRDRVYFAKIINGIVYHDQIERLIDDMIDISSLIFEPIPIGPIGPITLS